MKIEQLLTYTDEEIVALTKREPNTQCYRCERCYNCTKCIGCTSCKDCTYCYRCTGCINCLRCKNCRYCIDCEGLVGGTLMIRTRQFDLKTFLAARSLL